MSNTPIDPNNLEVSGIYWDYNNANDMELVNGLKRQPLASDYFSDFTFGLINGHEERLTLKNMKSINYNDILRMKYCTFLILLLFFANCRNENLHYDLIIKNNFSESICASYSQVFPDTTIDCRIINFNIDAGGKYQLTIRNGWENEFKRKSVLQIFVYDGNICKTEMCDTIKKYNKILKRYQLTLNDIESMNWIVNYP